MIVFAHCKEYKRLIFKYVFQMRYKFVYRLQNIAPVIIAFICAMCLNSCIQDYTGSVYWHLCISAEDSLEIQCPLFDNVTIQDTTSGRPNWLSIENSCVNSSGDAYIQGWYHFANDGIHKERYEYEYTERTFHIKRLSHNAPVKVILVYNMVQPDRYGWMPNNQTERDSVFTILEDIYGEENIITLSTDCTEKTFSFRP